MQGDLEKEGAFQWFQMPYLFGALCKCFLSIPLFIAALLLGVSVPVYILTGGLDLTFSQKVLNLVFTY